MSIFIPGMKLPRDCLFCPLAHWNRLDEITGCNIVPGKKFIPKSDEEYWQSSTRPLWCPIVEIKTPHGKLIDGTALFEVLSQETDHWTIDEVSHIETEDVIDALVDAPIIIKEEEVSE